MWQKRIEITRNASVLKFVSLISQSVTILHAARCLQVWLSVIHMSYVICQWRSCDNTKWRLTAFSKRVYQSRELNLICQTDFQNLKNLKSSENINWFIYNVMKVLQRSFRLDFTDPVTIFIQNDATHFEYLTNNSAAGFISDEREV